MPYFKIPSATVIEVTGADSPRYLNARLTNNVKALPVGSGCLAAALSAQGKTQALFGVYKLEVERVLLVSDGGESDEILSVFRQFIVADRVVTEDLTSLVSLFHVFGEERDLIEKLSGSEIITGDLFTVASHGEVISSVRVRGSEPGLDMLVPLEKEAAFLEILEGARARELFGNEIDLLRMKAGIPAFPSEVNERALFSEAGLTQALAFNRGCYVGQEVIERVDALGKAPRILLPVVFEGSDAIESGAEVTLRDEGSIGKIVTSIADPDDGHVYGFARVKNQVYDEASEIFSNGLSGKVSRAREETRHFQE